MIDKSPEIYPGGWLPLGIRRHDALTPGATLKLNTKPLSPLTNSIFIGGTYLCLTRALLSAIEVKRTALQSMDSPDVGFSLGREIPVFVSSPEFQECFFTVYWIV